MDCAKTASRLVARLGVALALVGLLVSVGCGDGGPARYDVSGAVTWGGKPVPAGSVTFMPDKGKGNSGPAVSVDIKDGKYDTSSSDTGHIGGPHTVRIVGLDGTTGDSDFVEGLPMFRTYETEADLSEESATQDLEVPADWE